jgi:hypothetical protein
MTAAFRSGGVVDVFQSLREIKSGLDGAEASKSLHPPWRFLQSKSRFAFCLIVLALASRPVAPGERRQGRGTQDRTQNRTQNHEIPPTATIGWPNEPEPGRHRSNAGTCQQRGGMVDDLIDPQAEKNKRRSSRAPPMSTGCTTSKRSIRYKSAISRGSARALASMSSGGARFPRRRSSRVNHQSERLEKDSDEDVRRISDINEAALGEIETLPSGRRSCPYPALPPFGHRQQSVLGHRCAVAPVNKTLADYSKSNAPVPPIFATVLFLSSLVVQASRLKQNLGMIGVVPCGR